jgi:hypothetical protein
MGCIMKKLFLLTAVAIASGTLAGCGGHDGDGVTVPPTPPASTSIKFETYAESLVSMSTCDTYPPVETNDKTFTFEGDQDTAEPRSTDTLTPACTAP